MTDERHGLEPDPWRENSNLPDLLGLRLVANATIPRVKAYLTRISAAELLALADWPSLQGSPPGASVLQAQLPDALLAVFAAPKLDSRAPWALSGRIAAVHLALAADLTRTTIGELMSLPKTTVRRLLATQPRVSVTTALSRQINMRSLRPLLHVEAFNPAAAPALEWAERPRILNRGPLRGG